MLCFFFPAEAENWNLTFTFFRKFKTKTFSNFYGIINRSFKWRAAFETRCILQGFFLFWPVAFFVLSCFFNNFFTLYNIPLRLVTRSFVLFSRGIISSALASNVEWGCFLLCSAESSSTWFVLAFWRRSVSMQSCSAASLSSMKVLEEDRMLFSLWPLVLSRCLFPY